MKKKMDDMLLKGKEKDLKSANAPRDVVLHSEMSKFPPSPIIGIDVDYGHEVSLGSRGGMDVAFDAPQQLPSHEIDLEALTTSSAVLTSGSRLVLPTRFMVGRSKGNS